jgi:uncharacterized protein (DUF433 family)
MQLDSYFEFVSADEIVVCGTRIGIEVILADYFAGNLPEEIVCEYPSLTLEQVHATITYYLHNRPAVDDYFQRWVLRGESAIRQQATSPLIERLLRARTEAAQ